MLQNLMESRRRMTNIPNYPPVLEELWLRKAGGTGKAHLAKYKSARLDTYYSFCGVWISDDVTDKHPRCKKCESFLATVLP